MSSTILHFYHSLNFGTQQQGFCIEITNHNVTVELISAKEDPFTRNKSSLVNPRTRMKFCCTCC